MKNQPSWRWKCPHCGKPLHDLWEKCECPGSVRAKKQSEIILTTLIVFVAAVALLSWFCS